MATREPLRHRPLAFSVAAALLLALMISEARASIIIADGAGCTLVDAVTAANTNAPAGGCSAGNDGNNGGDIIDLRTDVTLSVANNTDPKGCGNGLPAVTGVLTVNGNGHTIARSDVDGVAPFRLIDSTGGRLVLNDTTLKNGNPIGNADPEGGSGTLICDGGGLYGATVTLNHSTVSDNRARGTNPVSPRGGGIYATTVTLNSSAVLRNAIGQAGDPGPNGGSEGGGIYAETVTLNDSKVSGNTASVSVGGSGGGITGGTVKLNRSTVSDNNAVGFLGADGGGIVAETVTLIKSVVSGNRGGGRFGAKGGGLSATQATLSDSTVSGNSIDGVRGDVAGGGIAASTAILTNSTVSANSAGHGAVAGVIHGGGVSASSMTLTHSTVSGNRINTLGDGVVGGGGISGTATLTNSVVANNVNIDPSQIVSPSDCGGTAQFAGENFVGDGSCGASAAGQLTGDPLLGPLANNGGPTQTHALLTGSPAIDRISSIPGKGCADSYVTTDQRGVSRPQPVGGKCDIGAFELLANGPKLYASKLAARTSPVLLEGAVLLGNTYVFTAPDAGVARVEFQLDGKLVRTEKSAPFDFGGTTAAGPAAPYNTTALAPGVHTILARATMTDATVQTASGSFSIPGLYLSDSSSRSNPVVLNGRSVSSGNIYVFTTPDSGVAKVQFWLDSALVKTENLAPYDFSGTASDGTALPFHTVKLAKGAHVIGAHLTMKDGSVNKLTATFYR